MQFSTNDKTASLSAGEFAEFALGPRESFGGGGGVWRAQLGTHWHNELRTRTQAEHTTDGILADGIAFEVVIEGQLTHRGWTITLGGRIDQVIGTTLREIKTITQPVPMPAERLRADYAGYFLQLATYVVLRRLQGVPPRKAELVFVEAGSGLSQTVELTPFDEALVHHQLDALVGFLDERRRAAERRRQLQFTPPFEELRPGQESVQQHLVEAFERPPRDPRKRARIVLLEAPTGYGKTGVALDFALGQLKSGGCNRLIWLTGKATGQIQVIDTLRRMTAGQPPAFWQIRNKGEHCVNSTFHCVREACGYLAGAVERWPNSGLARFYLDEHHPRDLEVLRAAGREAGICPYEITRASLAFNDIWIGDYNYVFAPDNQGLFTGQPGFVPAETLLVIDEAHNLPSRVAGAYSHTANDQAVRGLLEELNHIGAPAMLENAVYEWARVLGSVDPCESLDPMTEADVRDSIARLGEMVTSQPIDYAALGPVHSETLWQFAKLDAFLADTRLHKLTWSPRPGTLEFTCVDAAAAIGDTLRQYGGALLMSATLRPFDQFAASCGLDDYESVRAEAPWRVGAYDAAVDLRVDTTLRNRGSHYGTTAATIEALHAASRGAIAVFFPSYAYAENVLRALDNAGSPLRVSLQPRLPDLAAQAAWVEETLVLADALFLVLGSSFAESIDLLGGRVSHAMIVGPALPEVNAVQKARLDAHAGLGREGAFRRVYQIPGMQKVNQALGRMVRAPGHHAKVLFHCRRFADSSYAALLDPQCQMYREIFTDEDLRGWLETK